MLAPGVPQYQQYKYKFQSIQEHACENNFPTKCKKISTLLFYIYKFCENRNKV